MEMTEWCCIMPTEVLYPSRDTFLSPEAIGEATGQAGYFQFRLDPDDGATYHFIGTVKSVDPLDHGEVLGHGLDHGKEWVKIMVIMYNRPKRIASKVEDISTC